MKINKAIITAAGYGTRFLPATKTLPKELIPIINKPTISYIVDQCVEAGITEIIIVTRYGNHAVEDYFDFSPALENYLKEKGKQDLLDKINGEYKGIKFIFVRQDRDLPYGNAAPLYSAKHLISEGEPFIYTWGDDIILGKGSGIKEVVDRYAQSDCEILLNCVKKSKEEISRIGAAVELDTNGKVVSINEKPSVEDINTDLLSVSPYVLTDNIFKYLDPKSVDAGEFIFQKGIMKMIESGEVVRVNTTEGIWLTTGDPLSYLKTTFEIAISRDDLRDDFIAFLEERLKQIN